MVLQTYHHLMQTPEVLAEVREVAVVLLVKVAQVNKVNNLEIQVITDLVTQVEIIEVVHLLVHQCVDLDITAEAAVVPAVQVL